MFQTELVDMLKRHTATHCITLEKAATHRNTPQHATTRHNTQQHTCTPDLVRVEWACTVTHCNALQNTATNSLQHTATHCFFRICLVDRLKSWLATKHTMKWSQLCNTLQRTAAHCNTLQHTRNTPKSVRFQTEHTIKTALTTHFSARQHTATHCNTPKSARYKT